MIVARRSPFPSLRSETRPGPVEVRDRLRLERAPSTRAQPSGARCRPRRSRCFRAGARNSSRRHPRPRRRPRQRARQVPRRRDARAQAPRRPDAQLARGDPRPDGRAWARSRPGRAAPRRHAAARGRGCAGRRLSRSPRRMRSRHRLFHGVGERRGAHAELGLGTSGQRDARFSPSRIPPPIATRTRIRRTARRRPPTRRGRAR